MSLLALLLLFGATASGKVNPNPPKWSPVYSVKGVLNMPYAEISEPIQVWFDSKNGKSRIDYYDGMVKTYQFDCTMYPPYGTAIKIAPTTTEEKLNIDTCFIADRVPIRLQSVLPDMKDFEYIGLETMHDSEILQWQMTQTEGDKISKYTVWVKYKKTLRGDIVSIPVRYEIKGYYDHYYFDYTDYNVEDIDSKVFLVDKSNCETVAGSLIKDQVTFNPMKEFIHPVYDSHIDEEFLSFKNKHRREYSSEIEHAKRLNLFRQNLRYIHSHNRANRGFTMAVNHLADRTDDELSALNGLKSNVVNHSTESVDKGLQFPYNQSTIKKMSCKLPTEFDWRIHGAVTPVKDQALCGSCWSFAATGAVEGALFLHEKHLKRLSEQALVDCSWGFGNHGCNGGWSLKAFKWIKKHGLRTDEDYGGYLGVEGYCHIDNVTSATVKIKDWVTVMPNDEKALKLALFKHGPIAIGIDASHKSIKFYSNGVYFEPRCRNEVFSLDHAVLAVGYGTLHDEKYWLIKNSWSNYWGNDGYMLMAIKDNHCGVQTAPYYVIF